MILGAEARGFIFGGALAYEFGCGFVPARKPGKLPAFETAGPVGMTSESFDVVKYLVVYFGTEPSYVRHSAAEFDSLYRLN